MIFLKPSKISRGSTGQEQTTLAHFKEESKLTFTAAVNVEHVENLLDILAHLGNSVCDIEDGELEDELFAVWTCFE